MPDDQFCFGLFGIEDDDQQPTVEKKGDKEELVVSTNIDLNSKICCICNSETIKYRCPGCGLRSCSLSCVKEHKDTFECDGKRDRTPFIRMHNFDQQAFMSDFFFLEEADNAVDKAARMRKTIVQSRTELPSWLLKIRYEARVRGTRMKILPAGFEKRKRNKTIYHFKDKCLHWTVEFEFSSEKSHIITLDRINENRTLKELISDLMDPKDVFEHYGRFHNLKFFKEAGVDNLSVFLKVDGHKMFWKIDPNETINKSLEGKTVVEYPTFIVTTKCKESDYPIISTNSVSVVQTRENGKNSVSVVQTRENETSAEEK